ncbi:MAG: MGMT family protein, partial [Microlunatus sp.]|nr:MGMT family protein [Microlunatus sp.]
MREDFVEAVLSAVESIPPGQVASYGDIAEFVGSGGPRQVGSVMSHYGGAVTWWRVVRADGRP